MRMGALILLWFVLAVTWVPSRGLAVSAVSHRRLDRILQLPQYRRWRIHHGYRTATHNPVFKLLDRMYHNFKRTIINPLLKWLHWKWHIKRTSNGRNEHYGHRDGASGAWGLGSAAGAFGKLLLCVLALVAMGLGGWIVWTIWSQRRGTAEESAVVPPVVNVKKALNEGDALAQNADAWLSLAQQLGQDGDWRMAYRAMYLALLSGLHETGRIHFRKSLTNHAYVNRYRGPREEIQIFSTLTDIFDRVWYGDKPVPAETRAGIDMQMKVLLKPPVAHA